MKQEISKLKGSALAIATCVAMSWAVTAQAHDSDRRAHRGDTVHSAHSRFAPSKQKDRHAHRGQHVHHRHKNPRRQSAYWQGYRHGKAHARHYFRAHNPHRYGWVKRPHRPKRYAWRNAHNHWRHHYGHFYR